MPSKIQNVYVLVYPNFAEFEIVQALLVLDSKSTNIVGFSRDIVLSYNGFPIQPELAITEIRTEEIDVFIIPGGEPKEIIGGGQMDREIEILSQKLKELSSAKKLIAAICGGPVFLAHAGILDGVRCTASIQDNEKEYFQDTKFCEDKVVRDQKILTAQGDSFIDFAIELGKMCNKFDSEEEIIETRKWLANER